MKLHLLLPAAAAPARPQDPPPPRPFAGPIWRNLGLTNGSGGVPGTSSNPFVGSSNVTLAQVPLNQIDGANSGSDCWGYVSPSGREYGIMCTSSGTAFFDVTVPSNPQQVGNISGPGSLWRDVKVYEQFAYIVSEGGSGIQVVSMANIDKGQETLTGVVNDVGTANTHNVFIDEDAASSTAPAAVATACACTASPTRPARSTSAHGARATSTTRRW